MGTIVSPVLRIDTVYFKPFPGRCVKMERVINVGGCIFGVKKIGDRLVYTTSRLSRPFAYIFNKESILSNTFKALLKLGLIDKKDAAAHLASIVKRDKMLKRRQAVSDVRNGLAKLEIEMPKDLDEILTKKDVIG